LLKEAEGTQASQLVSADAAIQKSRSLRILLRMQSAAELAATSQQCWIP